MVMGDIGGDFQMLSQMAEGTAGALGAVDRAVNNMHELGFVHGDLRDTNIFYRMVAGKEEVLFLD